MFNEFINYSCINNNSKIILIITLIINYIDKIRINNIPIPIIRQHVYDIADL